MIVLVICKITAGDLIANHLRLFYARFYLLVYTNNLDFLTR